MLPSVKVRITQRFEATRSGVDLASAGQQLAQHAQTVNDLALVQQGIAGDRLLQIYEGAATAEPDAGHLALNNRRAADAFGLQMDGESIVVVEFPEERKAAWPPSDD